MGGVVRLRYWSPESRHQRLCEIIAGQGYYGVYLYEHEEPAWTRHWRRK